jgi:phosphate starvation-inducible PhoH-like protein
LEEKLQPLDLTLEPESNERLANLCGQFDQHLRQLEERLRVEIHNRGAKFQVIGEPRSAHAAGRIIKELYGATEAEILSPERVHLYLQEAHVEQAPEGGADAVVATRQEMVRPRGQNQIDYVHSIRHNDLTFGIGPAGTGKTYLAVACAVESLDAGAVRRIVLVRPAVEAGERLGFLPGDLAQKVDPYLRPIYDALYELLGFDRVAKLVERNVIEVAPLAYMRGRTLNHAFVIMDEAQNTTVEQMKMFLTRIGFGSTTVVTGDVTQIDLARNTVSGLRHIRPVLLGVNGIEFVDFESRDVVRHPLVKRIVNAYEKFERESSAQDSPSLLGPEIQSAGD